MEIQVIPVFGAFGKSIFALVFDSGPFAKFILLILAVISIVSWAIIFDRSRLYTRLRKGGRTLTTALSTKGLAIPMETVKRSMPSVEGALLLETKKYVEEARRRNPDDGETVPSAEQLRQLLEGRATTEIAEMEKYLIFLATTSGVAPFLGLLGTVWGIMSSFLSMGAEGTASIEVVGPGIAEALITTIAGLAAAIPALVGYNLLVRHVHRQETLVELFVSRLLMLTGGRIRGPVTVKGETLYEKESI
jgi:biopolymer transport protein TolQ